MKHLPLDHQISINPWWKRNTTGNVVTLALEGSSDFTTTRMNQAPLR
jgi:hypothetical protein